MTGTVRAVAMLTLTIVVLVAPAVAHAGVDPFESEPASIDVPPPLTARQRADDIDQTTGRLIGSIRIPDIGLDAPLRSGVALEVIDRGPAHWVGSAAPGATGNLVIAGHRATHTAPFRHLDSLDPGDLVYVTDGTGFEVIYRVAETFIVKPEDVWITYATPKPVLTMFACHPVGSAAERIVVRADLVGGRLIA